MESGRPKRDTVEILAETALQALCFAKSNDKFKSEFNTAIENLRNGLDETPCVYDGEDKAINYLERLRHLAWNRANVSCHALSLYLSDPNEQKTAHDLVNSNYVDTVQLRDAMHMLRDAGYENDNPVMMRLQNILTSKLLSYMGISRTDDLIAGSRHFDKKEFKKALDNIAGEKNQFSYEDREYFSKQIISHINQNARKYTRKEKVELFKIAANHRLITGKTGLRKVEETQIVRDLLYEAGRCDELAKKEKNRLKK